MENGILIKSERISQKPRKLIIATIAIVLLIATIIAFILDYKDYREGQEFGLALFSVTSELSGSAMIDPNDSYEDQCNSAYNRIDGYAPDYTFNGYKFDNSAVRHAEYNTSVAFAELMIASGYDRFPSYQGEYWFKYSNADEFFRSYFCKQPLFLMCLGFMFACIFALCMIPKEEKKELIVFEDSVLFRVNKTKTVQMSFPDIYSVVVGVNRLKITGAGLKFTIIYLANAEAIRSAIIERKNTALTAPAPASAPAPAPAPAPTPAPAPAPAPAPIDDTDMLLKYKDLLDKGVLTQEEFDAKKKQILGL